jgi:hypothetical protein
MNMKVNFLIITIVAILFGTSMTTTTNTIWATSPQVKIDSQSCHSSASGGFRVNDIDFSWSGFEPNVKLSVDILDGYKNTVATKNLQGSSDSSGSGDISISLYINAPYKLVLYGPPSGADVDFTTSCGNPQDKKK